MHSIESQIVRARIKNKKITTAKITATEMIKTHPHIICVFCKRDCINYPCAILNHHELSSRKRNKTIAKQCEYLEPIYEKNNRKWLKAYVKTLGLSTWHKIQKDELWQKIIQFIKL